MPNDALRQAQADVPADSSLAPTDNTAANSGPAADNQSGDKGKQGSGQTLEQMRAEILRKTEERFARLEGKLDSVLSQPNQKTTDSTPALTDMSSAELEAMRPHIPKDKEQAFDELVRTRREEERVDARLDVRLSQRELISARKQSNNIAFSRYPELHNEGGSLHREVNKILDERGDDLVKKDPDAVLNAANEAAYRLGIKPRANSERTSTGHIGGRTAPAADAEDASLALSDSEAKEIAGKLAAALPAGKTFTAETLKRVQANTAEYRKHQDLFIK